MADDKKEISLGDIIDFTEGQISSNAKERRFCRVSTDSRTAGPGDLFVALRGPKYDGHSFIADALKKGAAGVVAESLPNEKIIREYEPVVIQVPDSLKALGDMASGWRRKFSTPVGVLTGSNGKTTTKEMTVAILRLCFSCLWSPGNFNNRIGLPLTLLTLRPEHERVVLEMGMNEPGEIKTLTSIAGPDVGALLNIGPAHLERFSSIEAIAAAKAEMLDELPNDSVFIYNQEDFRLCSLAERWQGPKQSFGFSPGCDVRLIEAIEQGFFQKIHMEIQGQEISTEIQLPGRHNISNALAAAALSFSLGVSRDAIQEGLARFRPISGRFVLRRHKNFMLVDDCYNANPGSMESALETLQRISGTADRILVLGDMLELGAFSRAAHLELGRRAVQAQPSLLCVTGDFSRWVKQAAEEEGFPPEQIVLFTDADEVAGKILSRLQGGEWILVKGSRGMALERVIESLEKTSKPLEVVVS